jgi:hypothetical protein
MNAFEFFSYMSSIYTRKHHKEDSSCREISFRMISVKGSFPKDILVWGSSPGWKDTFAIDNKGGDIYQMQRIEAWFQGE